MHTSRTSPTGPIRSQGEEVEILSTEQPTGHLSPWPRCARRPGGRSPGPLAWTLACLLSLSTAAVGAPGVDPPRASRPPCRHPVGVGPGRLTLPADAPLTDGLLTCATCHTGPDGGPLRWAAAEPHELCFRCHGRASFERFYPHRVDPQDPLGGRICLQCHVEKPVLGRGGVGLRAGVGAMCQGCHRPVPHVGAAEHAGPLDASMNQRRQRAEASAGVILPLDEQGRMGCGTCHNPHDAAAIPPTVPAGRHASAEDPVIAPALFGTLIRESIGQRAEAAGIAERIRPRNRSGSRLRLPLRTGELCAACHDMTLPPERKP